MCVAAVAVAIGLAACGSSSSTSSSAASASTQFQARLNLAKCFRAHGLNVPDPTANGGAAGGAGGGGLFRSLQNYSQAQISAARQACQQYFAQAFPRANLSPAQQAQARAQIVKFAQCMRSHGVNIPDPTANGGGFGFRQAFRSVDRNSPAFQAAAKACQSLRPRFGRGGAGGAAPTAPAVGPAGGGSSASV